MTGPWRSESWWTPVTSERSAGRQIVDQPGAVDPLHAQHDRQRGRRTGLAVDRPVLVDEGEQPHRRGRALLPALERRDVPHAGDDVDLALLSRGDELRDRKSTRLNSSHVKISYA